VTTEPPGPSGVRDRVTRAAGVTRLVFAGQVLALLANRPATAQPDGPQFALWVLTALLLWRVYQHSDGARRLLLLVYAVDLALALRFVLPSSGDDTAWYTAPTLLLEGAVGLAVFTSPVLREWCAAPGRPGRAAQRRDPRTPAGPPS
jgi:hypothetical protein